MQHVKIGLFLRRAANQQNNLQLLWNVAIVGSVSRAAGVPECELGPQAIFVT